MRYEREIILVVSQRGMFGYKRAKGMEMEKEKGNGNRKEDASEKKLREKKGI